MSAYDSEEAFERLMDDLQVLLGARAGKTLTQEDVDALKRLERHWSEDGERATDAYHRGYHDALRASGGDALVEANERADRLWAEAASEKAMRKFDELRGFRNGAAACRETMARFVEQGGDAVTANSIRLNWNPEWGSEPAASDVLSSLQGAG